MGQIDLSLTAYHYPSLLCDSGFVCFLGVSVLWISYKSRRIIIPLPSIVLIIFYDLMNCLVEEHNGVHSS